MLAFQNLSSVERAARKEEYRVAIAQDQAVDQEVAFDGLAGGEGAMAEGAQGRKRHELIDNLKVEYGGTFDAKGGTEAVLNELADFLCNKIGDPEAKNSLARREFSFNDSKEIRKYKSALRAILDPNPDAPYGYNLHPGAPNATAGGRTISLREALAYFWLAASDQNMPLEEGMEDQRADLLEAERENVAEFLSDLRREYSKVRIDFGDGQGLTSYRAEELTPGQIEQLSVPQKAQFAVDKASCPPGQFGRITAMGLYNQHAVLAKPNPILNVGDDILGFVCEQFENLPPEQQFNIKRALDYQMIMMNELPETLGEIRDHVNDNGVDDIEKYNAQFLLGTFANPQNLVDYFERVHNCRLTQNEKNFAYITLLDKIKEFAGQMPYRLVDSARNQGQRNYINAKVNEAMNTVLDNRMDDTFVLLNSMHSDLTSINEKLTELAGREVNSGEELLALEQEKRALIEQMRGLIERKGEIINELRQAMIDRAGIIRGQSAALIEIEDYRPAFEADFNVAVEQRITQEAIKNLPIISGAINDLEVQELNCHLALGAIGNNEQKIKAKLVDERLNEYLSNTENLLEHEGDKLIALRDALDEISNALDTQLGEGQLGPGLEMQMATIHNKLQDLRQYKENIVNDFLSGQGIDLDVGAKNELINGIDEKIQGLEPSENQEKLVQFAQKADELIQNAEKAQSYYFTLVSLALTDIQELDLTNANPAPGITRMQNEFFDNLENVKNTSPAMIPLLIDGMSDENKNLLVQSTRFLHDYPIVSNDILNNYNPNLGADMTARRAAIIGNDYQALGQIAGQAGRDQRHVFCTSLAGIYANDQTLTVKLLNDMSDAALERLNRSLIRYRGGVVGSVSNELMTLVNEVRVMKEATAVHLAELAAQQPIVPGEDEDVQLGAPMDSRDAEVQLDAPMDMREAEVPQPAPRRANFNLTSFQMHNQKAIDSLTTEQLEAAQKHLNMVKSNAANVPPALRDYLNSDYVAQIQTPKAGDTRVVIVFRALKQGEANTRKEVDLDEVKRYAEQYQAPDDRSELFARIVDDNLIMHYLDLGAIAGPRGRTKRDDFVKTLEHLRQNDQGMFNLVLSSQNSNDLTRLLSSVNRYKEGARRNGPPSYPELIAAIGQAQETINEQFDSIDNNDELDKNNWDMDRANVYMEKLRNIVRMEPDAIESARRARA